MVLEVIVDRVAGLDVHKDAVMAAVRAPDVPVGQHGGLGLQPQDEHVEVADRADHAPEPRPFSGHRVGGSFTVQPSPLSPLRWRSVTRDRARRRSAVS